MAILKENWSTLTKPTSIVLKEGYNDLTKSVIVMEPFARGYGNTLGNSLRRVLLSSINGFAVTSVKNGKLAAICDADSISIFSILGLLLGGSHLLLENKS